MAKNSNTAKKPAAKRLTLAEVNKRLNRTTVRQEQIVDGLAALKGMVGDLPPMPGGGGARRDGFMEIVTALENSHQVTGK